MSGRRQTVRAARNRALMPTVPAIYSRDQREALAAAYGETDTTAADVVALAANGTLRHPDGVTLAPFTVPENTVRSVARREAAREAARKPEPTIADLPHRDAVEQLRRRLARVIDIEVERLEGEMAEGQRATGEQLRQMARAMRELAAIPEPLDPTPPAPGAKVNGVRNGAETRGGIGARILAEIRAENGH